MHFDLQNFVSGKRSTSLVNSEIGIFLIVAQHRFVLVNLLPDTSGNYFPIHFCRANIHTYLRQILNFPHIVSGRRQYFRRYAATIKTSAAELSLFYDSTLQSLLECRIQNNIASAGTNDDNVVFPHTVICTSYFSSIITNNSY